MHNEGLSRSGGLGPLSAGVYKELRRRAAAYLRGERAGHTLAPTALVHEALMRLLDGGGRWRSPAHFVAVSARMMRHVLVDSARAHRAAKRPDPADRVEADADAAVVMPPDCEVLAMHEALAALSAVDARQATIVELKYFGGLSEQEIANALGISRATVTREWQSARAWLYRRITAR